MCHLEIHVVQWNGTIYIYTYISIKILIYANIQKSTLTYLDGWYVCLDVYIYHCTWIVCVLLKGCSIGSVKYAMFWAKRRIYCVEVYKWIPWINMCVVCMKHHDRKAPQSLSDEEPQVWLLKVSATTGTVYYLYIRGQIIQTSDDGKLEKEVYMRNLGILFRVVNNCTCHVCNYTDYI